MIETRFTDQGREYTGLAEVVAGRVWVHFQGKTFVLEIGSNARSRRKGTATASSSDEIRAPMPGKVTKVFKNAGDEVARGESVLVMEAMKMEYTLKSEIAGTIETVNVLVDHQVALGQALVKIKPGKEA